MNKKSILYWFFTLGMVFIVSSCHSFSPRYSLAIDDKQIPLNPDSGILIGKVERIDDDGKPIPFKNGWFEAIDRLGAKYRIVIDNENDVEVDENGYFAIQFPKGIYDKEIKELIFVYSQRKVNWVVQVYKGKDSLRIDQGKVYVFPIISIEINYFEWNQSNDYGMKIDDKGVRSIEIKNWFDSRYPDYKNLPVENIHY